jgi:hypothetical protein
MAEGGRSTDTVGVPRTDLPDVEHAGVHEVAHDANDVPFGDAQIVRDGSHRRSWLGREEQQHHAMVRKQGPSA